MFGVIAGLTFLLLARAFRSILLAVKALLLNVVSLAATYGAMTWFWQEGHGSSAVFGIPATGAITFWLPLMVFAFLFGLSMDYEVFILTRVREEYDRTGSTDAAVVAGLGRTGRLVTSAALVTRRPVRPIPCTTAVRVEPVRSYSSRIRLRMKTS